MCQNRPGSIYSCDVSSLDEAQDWCTLVKVYHKALASEVPPSRTSAGGYGRQSTLVLGLVSTDLCRRMSWRWGPAHCLRATARPPHMCTSPRPAACTRTGTSCLQCFRTSSRRRRRRNRSQASAQGHSPPLYVIQPETVREGECGPQ